MGLNVRVLGAMLLVLLSWTWPAGSEALFRTVVAFHLGENGEFVYIDRDTRADALVFRFFVGFPGDMKYKSVEAYYPASDGSLAVYMKDGSVLIITQYDSYYEEPRSLGRSNRVRQVRFAEASDELASKLGPFSVDNVCAKKLWDGWFNKR